MSSSMYCKRGMRGSINPRFLFLLGLFSSLTVIQLGGISLFLIFAYMLFLYGLVRKNLSICINTKFLPFLVSIVFSFLLSLFSNLPSGYLINNIKGLLNYLIIFVLAFSIVESDNKETCLYELLSGLCCSCRVQSVWIIGQTILWNLLKIDVNKLIFSDILGLVEKASQYKGTGYVPTGLCWNAGGIAPILFLGFFLEKRLILKITIAVSAFLTQSATLTIGMSLCIVFMIVYNVSKMNVLVKCKKNISSIFAGLVLILIFLFVSYRSFGVIRQQFDRLWEVFSYRIDGLLNSSSAMDSSTSAHLGYFTNLPYALGHGSFANAFFGFGINCSGFPYSAVTGQYSDQVWIVECDFVNILLNFGIIGFLFFYVWLMGGVLNLREKGAIFYAFLVIAFMGITYNLQYIWLIFIELILFSKKVTSSEFSLH